MAEALGVLAFGAVVIIAEVVVTVVRGRGWGPLSVRIIGLSMVVISVMFLTLSSASVDRLAGAYALLGTIAGYLVGHYDRDGSDG